MLDRYDRKISDRYKMIDYQDQDNQKEIIVLSNYFLNTTVPTILGTWYSYLANIFPFPFAYSYNANIWINITKSFFSFQDSLVSYFSAVAAPEKEARFAIFVVVTHENSKYYNKRIKHQINHIL